MRPAAYFSRHLTSAESNYPIHDKEMLSIVACLQDWKAELKSVAKLFKIWSDHKNLSYFASKRLLNERQVRYDNILQQFHYALEWRPDALTRRDQDKPTGLNDEQTAGQVMPLLPHLPVNPVNFEISKEKLDTADKAVLFDEDELQTLWKRGVQSDGNWRSVRDSVRDGERGFPPDLVQKIKSNIGKCTIVADNILRNWKNRVWVPNYEPLRSAIMQQSHDSHLASHPGKDTMAGIILRRWFWPRIRESVQKFIRNCDICGQTTIWREAKAGFLRSLPIPDCIGSELTIDFVPDLPKSRGCTNVMVITDRLR